MCLYTLVNFIKYKFAVKVHVLKCLLKTYCEIRVLELYLLLSTIEAKGALP